MCSCAATVLRRWRSPVAASLSRFATAVVRCAVPLGVAGAPLCRCSSASAGRMRRRMRLRTDSGGGGCTAKRSSSGANGTEVHKHDSRRSAVIVAANKMAELVRESLIASSTGAMVAKSTRSFIARARRVCLHLRWKTRAAVCRGSSRRQEPTVAAVVLVVGSQPRGAAPRFLQLLLLAPLSAPRGRVVRRRARAFSSLASIVPVANGTAGSSQGARSAARRHTAAHRWRGGTQRTRAIGVEKVERLANLLLLLLRERLLGLGGRPFRGRHANGKGRN